MDKSRSDSNKGNLFHLGRNHTKFCSNEIDEALCSCDNSSLYKIVMNLTLKNKAI
jgi:hypothetical protein